MIGMFQPLIMAYNNNLKVLGKGSLLLTFNLIEKGIYVLLILIVLKKGAIYLASIQLFLSAIMFIVLMITLSIVMNYKIREQISDIGKSLLSAVIMGLLVYLTAINIDNSIVRLVTASLAGFFSYSVFTIILNWNLANALREKYIKKNTGKI